MTNEFPVEVLDTRPRHRRPTQLRRPATPQLCRSAILSSCAAAVPSGYALAVPFNAFFSVFGVERHDDTSLLPRRLFDVLSKWLFSNDSAMAGIARTAPVADLSAVQREKPPKLR
ncbi:hypothetical protein EMB92_08245 [Bifidobacterium callitrichos]|uniref:Uncharacterized protein n=1 Tax=Bifidobacterium callitrichos TaxID=762209 RepID=A0A5M9ZD83_9BIFI|nr:hypothetical protein [Bifidobacterium callitrichos]KAA8815927.1 hypothetical protein EMB92_08245 [Bifidobacterium callitrichos]